MYSENANKCFKCSIDNLLSSLLSVKLSTQQTLCRQDEFIARLVSVVEEMKRKNNLSRDQKRTYLRNTLDDPTLEMATFKHEMALPLDPTVTITGLDMSKVRICSTSDKFKISSQLNGFLKKNNVH